MDNNIGLQDHDILENDILGNLALGLLEVHITMNQAMTKFT